LQETKRKLPANWHLTGAMGVDFSVNYPPLLEDGNIKNFLDEGEELADFTVKPMHTMHGLHCEHKLCAVNMLMLKQSISTAVMHVQCNAAVQHTTKQADQLQCKTFAPVLC
jgi:hypothetical protein